MSAPTPASDKPATPPPPKKTNDGSPDRVYLVPYPKIIFLYPTLVCAFIAAVGTHIFVGPSDPASRFAIAIGTIFLGILAVNLVILAFDFPRTTSLTLLFFVAAVVMGLILLFTFWPEIWPGIANFIRRFHPMANATFYWTVFLILGGLFIIVAIVVRFDYWEVRGNELLHHHSFLGNLERLSAPNLRMEKDIPDIFEYFLLRSGRLVIYTSNDRQPIVLDNVPFIDRKEAAVTRMLGALQVQMRTDSK